MPPGKRYFYLKNKQFHVCSKSLKWNKLGHAGTETGGSVARLAILLPSGSPRVSAQLPPWHQPPPLLPLCRLAFGADAGLLCSPRVQPAGAFVLSQCQLWILLCVTFQWRHSSSASTFQCLNSTSPGGMSNTDGILWHIVCLCRPGTEDRKVLERAGSLRKQWEKGRSNWLTSASISLLKLKLYYYTNNLYSLYRNRKLR